MSTEKPKEKEGEGSIRLFRALVVVFVGAAIAFFVYTTTVDTESKYQFRLGLDLAGGSHLVYDADVSDVDPLEVEELMSVLRDVIERRVNVFGVSEPIVQVEKSSFVSGEGEYRLVVELPGVSDVEEAVKEIGRTPLLEFKLLDREKLAALDSLEQANLGENATSGAIISNVKVNGEEVTDPYTDTGLTGRYLERAELRFGNGGAGVQNEPVVSIQFNKEGADLFEQITGDNVGEQLAIFLDGEIVSAPRINESISGGTAIISGSFAAEEARDLVQNLNFGALPLPIVLLSTQTIGASLGAGILDKGIEAAVVGLILVIMFIVSWYRAPGIVAGFALLIYSAIMLALFKLIPVTLTAAGLAGFILSLGMAVDANVLVFERMKEGYRKGLNSQEAATVGFSRAWSAIRDGNITSILSAVVLFWFGTSIVKGFALVFGIGVVVSMLTAVLFTRTILVSLPSKKLSDNTWKSKLFDSGFFK